LTGFLSEAGQMRWAGPWAWPLDKRGALLVADDVGNVIWRVSALPR
jgi:glucose/arabinose dehydrogenase